VLGLTGCTPADFATARYIDGELVFNFCQEAKVHLVQVVVEEISAEPPPVQIVWQVQGEGFFSQHDRIVLGQVPQGFETKTEYLGLPTEISDDTRIVLSTGGTSGGNFVIEELSSEYWLHQGGRRSDEPCG
jgi:hypothetical protein